MMKKIYLTLAVVTSALFYSCSNDTIGDAQEPPSQGTEDAITFGSTFKAVTRATSNTGTAAEMLDNHFKVLGVKKVSSTWSPVFFNYIVWNNATPSSSNPDADWEYVGTTAQKYGADQTALPSQQYIKYWDQKATNYHFVAGSPASAFTFNTSDGNITSATVTGIAGHINVNTGTALVANPVYIATPVNVEKTSGKFGSEVSFTFNRLQSFVRVGFYETISGYKITDINFYPYNESSDAWGTTTTHNITLASKTANYFTGATNAQVAVSYAWEGEGAPKYTYVYESGLTQQKNWYGGALTLSATNPLATTSTETTKTYFYGTDNDMATTGYFTVVPSPSNLTAAPILVKCDYTLESLDNSGEKIEVTGATAAIPAAFALWKDNTSYTYLFKITDNDLCPITFDAVVVATEEHGVITTITTPNITTYQEGSVTDEGIQYKYNSSAPKPIYFTAQNSETGALITLTTGGDAVSNVQVYKLDGEKTEADLQLSAPTTTFTTNLVGTAVTIKNWTIPAGAAYFTPDATGYYAIQYQTKTSPTAYTYKIVHVE